MSQEGREDPLRLHKEGTALYDSGKYKEAAEKFLRASGLYEKAGNFFDASYSLFKAGECHFLLKNYEASLDPFDKAAKIALEKGYDRFGVGALEYSLDSYKALGKEKSKVAADLKSKIAEVKKKLEAQGF